MRHRELFRSAQLPVLQNKMFRSAAEARNCSKGDMVLVEDTTTGLVHNAAFDPRLIEYDADYQNEQACSGVFKQHLDDVSGIVERFFKGQTLVEVGCGKGYFLEHLQQRGYRVTGVDPAYEGSNPGIIKAQFEPGLGISGEAVILRHVLEHVPNPTEFLASIAQANAGKGSIYIEVPCFDWIYRNRAWYDVFYEHVNYFRPDDFHRMFGTVHAAGHIFGGQYLYAVTELGSLRQPTARRDDPVNFPGDFLDRIDQIVRLQTAGKRNAIWGGASKGVIFALYMERAGLRIDAVIDINPAKQGKFLAATGILVSSPEQALATLSPGDNVFVMNSNYLQEIRAQSGNKFNYLTVDHNDF